MASSSADIWTFEVTHDFTENDQLWKQMVDRRCPVRQMTSVPKGTTGYIDLAGNMKPDGSGLKPVVLVKLFDVRRPNAYPGESNYLLPSSILRRGTKKLAHFTLHDPSSMLKLRPQPVSGSPPVGMDYPLAKFLQALIKSLYDDTKQGTAMSNKELLIDAGLSEDYLELAAKCGSWAVIKPMLDGKTNAYALPQVASCAPC
jgi:hypothetical protein